MELQILYIHQIHSRQLPCQLLGLILVSMAVSTGCLELLFGLPLLLLSVIIVKNLLCTISSIICLEFIFSIWELVVHFLSTLSQTTEASFYDLNHIILHDL